MHSIWPLRAPHRLRGTPTGSRRTRGQSLVEFALVVPIMLLLLLGAIQFGVIWATQVGVTNAVRDAARAASGVQPKDGSAGAVDAGTEATYANSYMTDVLVPGLQKNVPLYSDANVQAKTICYTTFSDTLSGTTSLQATVTVTYGHPIFIPLLATVLGSGAIATTTALSIPVGLDLPFSLASTPASAGTTGC